MSGNTFVPKNRSWIFNRCTNIKILRFRIVGGNEKEPSWVLVVNTGRIHETARAGRLKSFGQLANLKRPEIVRQGYQIVFLQETMLFCFWPFLRFQKGFLTGGKVAVPFGMGPGNFGNGKEVLVAAITADA